MGTMIENWLAKRLREAAAQARGSVFMPTDPEAESMPEEELRPGELVAGHYDLPVLILGREGAWARVVPVSALPEATLASEVAIPFGRRRMVFCGWAERRVRVEDLWPAIWRGTLLPETLNRVRKALGEGAAVAQSPALLPLVEAYKRAAAYPWGSCFPALSAVAAQEAEMAQEVTPIEKVVESVRGSVKRLRTLLSPSPPAYALAADSGDVNPLDMTEEHELEEAGTPIGTLTVRIRERTQIKKLTLSLTWRGKTPLRLRLLSKSEGICEPLELQGEKTKTLVIPREMIAEGLDYEYESGKV